MSAVQSLSLPRPSSQLYVTQLCLIRTSLLSLYQWWGAGCSSLAWVSSKENRMSEPFQSLSHSAESGSTRRQSTLNNWMIGSFCERGGAALSNWVVGSFVVRPRHLLSLHLFTASTRDASAVTHCSRHWHAWFVCLNYVHIYSITDDAFLLLWRIQIAISGGADGDHVWGLEFILST